MSEIGSKRERLRALLGPAVEGELSDEAARELTDLLREDTEMRREFVQYLQMHAMLSEEDQILRLLEDGEKDNVMELRGSGDGITLRSTASHAFRRGGNAMAPYNFDDRNIKWNTLTLPTLGEVKHLLFSVLSVDEENHIVQVLFKFAANEKIPLHRHMVHNNTFVVQGEHRLYEPDGTLKEIRPTGTYKSAPPGDVHREGGGSEQDVIVFFDMRGRDGLFYEILDDDQNVIAALSYTDFLGAYKAQQGVA